VVKSSQVLERLSFGAVESEDNQYRLLRINQDERFKMNGNVKVKPPGGQCVDS
jgi:hypothetical protein